jgi:hypothetical protein
MVSIKSRRWRAGSGRYAVLTVVKDAAGSSTPGRSGGLGSSVIDEIVREGARAMLAAALRAEVAAYVEAHADEVDEDGHRLVVRNGYAQSREVLTSSGAVEVAPQVNDRRVEEAGGGRKRFASAILPPWCRKSPRINEVLPLLYLRLDEVRLCLLVLIGVRADGAKELVTLADGFRESTGSWADLLRDAKRRGMRAPVLAVGDGALGFWSALGEVFPNTRAQKCWFHKSANVLAALPKSAHPGARKALAEIWGAEDKDHARTAVQAFADLYGAKFPKAVAKITDDVEELLAFYDYPAEHWIHPARRALPGRPRPAGNATPTGRDGRRPLCLERGHPAPGSPPSTTFFAG